MLMLMMTTIVMQFTIAIILEFFFHGVILSPMKILQ